jgi:hypothetical protein
MAGDEPEGDKNGNMHFPQHGKSATNWHSAGTNATCCLRQFDTQNPFNLLLER